MSSKSTPFSGVTSISRSGRKCEDSDRARRTASSAAGASSLLRRRTASEWASSAGRLPPALGAGGGGERVRATRRVGAESSLNGKSVTKKAATKRAVLPRLGEFRLAYKT